MPRLTIGRKLTAGFATLILMLAGLTLFIQFKVSSIASDQDHVINELTRATQSAQSIGANVHAALSYHRGYIILGLPQLVTQRDQAWANIDEQFAELKERLAGVENAKVHSALDELQTLLPSYHDAQQQIIDIAWEPENQPATVAFFREVAPRARAMTEALDGIIQLESDQPPAADRRRLLTRITAAKGHLLQVSGALSTFLVDGSSETRENFESRLADCGASVAQLKTDSNLLTPAQAKLFSTYLEERAEMLVQASEVVALRSAADWNVAQYLCLNEVTPMATRANELIDEITEIEIQELNVAEANLTQHAEGLVRTLMISAVFIVALAIVLALLITRSITRPLRAVIDRVDEIAEGDGDLTQRVDDQRGDELGELGGKVNNFIAKTHDIIFTVRQASHEVASAATELSATSEQMSASMNLQNAQVGEIGQAIEEMSSAVVDVARKAADASQSAAKAGDAARNGGDVVNQTIEGMNTISAAVTDSANSVHELGKRGDQIGEIIATINDIADQTNLLALNAAIEAARAGEHGRGFAVVADEVRKLADRTTQATDEIAQSISAIQIETQEAVSRMTSGTDQVGQGVESAREAGRSLDQIVGNASEVAAMIQSIAAATEEQSATTEQITLNIDTASSSIREAAEGASQSSMAVVSLSQKAEELQALIGRFKLADRVMS